MSVDPRPKYETKTIHAVRGMESRTIEKWERDGWEFVDRAPRGLRSAITMRREKKQVRPLFWIVGGSAFILLAAGAITAGIISEKNAEPVTVETPSSTVATTDATESPTPTPTVDTACNTKPFDRTCTFGQTAKYLDEGDDVSLDIAVKSPESFVPSAEASFYNSRAHEEPAKAHIIYFEVTITNTSPDTDKDFDFIFTNATSATEGETEVLRVDDGDISGFFEISVLKPGESYTFKNGWSLDSLDRLELAVAVDGLAGYSVEFSAAD